MAKPKKQPAFDDIRLNNRQARFIAEYLKDFNATQAAIRAGYSEDSARSIGSELLTNPDIDRIIRGKVAAQLAEVEASNDRIVLELARIAFSSPGIKPIEEWTEDEKAGIVGVEYLRKGVAVLKVRRESKTKALELLAKIRGMFVEKVEVSGELSMVETRLLAGRKRVAALKGAE
jgi:phage terminase small subunit